MKKLTEIIIDPKGKTWTPEQLRYVNAHPILSPIVIKQTSREAGEGPHLIDKIMGVDFPKEVNAYCQSSLDDNWWGDGATKVENFLIETNKDPSRGIKNIKLNFEEETRYFAVQFYHIEEK